MNTTTLEELKVLIRGFAEHREWGAFHTPRNLLLALVGEIGELAAEFQWIPDDEIDEELKVRIKYDCVSNELADVLIYLIRLSDVLRIDLTAATLGKIRENEVRYPVEQSRGSSAKYTAYES